MDEFKIPEAPQTIPEHKPSSNAALVHTAESETSTPVLNSETSVTKAPQNTTTSEICPYKEPPWSAAPAANERHEYKFEVLKSGQIIEEVNNLQTKAVWKFGRLPSNDIEMAHPTISRFHAIMQYRPRIESENFTEENDAAKFEPGWYIYDLGSTHGTFLNKQRVPPKTYIRVRVGHMLRLGASTRCYILQGPSEDEEPESELTVTELRAQRQRYEAEKEAKALEAQQLAEKRQRERELAGISWGMSEDADEETDLTVNPYASTNNEELFLDDPKRTLRGFFEREGLELVYKCDEMSAGSFVCRIELPLDDSNGRPVIAEVIHKGRKKECVVQCAMEACRILDRYGVLRQANQEPLKRKTKAKDSDDDDEFLDRTGDIERKKLRKAQATADVTLTYDDLLKQEMETLAKIEQIQREIEKYQEVQKLQKAANVESDADNMDLDGFMQSLRTDGNKQLDKTEIRKLRMQEQNLKADYSRVQHLLKMAKPTELLFPPSGDSVALTESVLKKAEKSKKQLPIIGKRNQFSKFKIAKPPARKENLMRNENPCDQEEEEDEEEQQRNKRNYINAIKKPSERTELIEGNNLTKDKEKEHAQMFNEQTDHKSATNSEESNEISDNLNLGDSSSKEQQSNITSTCSRKRRQRLRMRTKRTEIDIDELADHESTEKYAKWIPPENQTGDGITQLNEKFGY